MQINAGGRRPRHIVEAAAGRSGTKDVDHMIRTTPSPYFAAAAALGSAAAGSSAIAAAHLWRVASYGVICGQEAGHCAACFAAPMLALASLAAIYRGLSSPVARTLAGT